MPTHETAPAATSAAFGGADVPPESAEHGASTLATALPLLVSPALAKFASGVEAVMNSQSNLARVLERLQAEILRLDAAPSTPAQVAAAEKLKSCRKMIESVSKCTKNIKTRIGAINGYKATIIQHMPELKTVGSIGAAAKSCGSITAEAADAAPDAFEADAAPPASAAVHIPLTDQPITAHNEDATSSAAATVAGAAAGDGGELE